MKKVLIILFAIGCVGALALFVFAYTPSVETPLNAPCPVMPERRAVRTIHVEYEGKTYYLCCTTCRRKFSENPRKYVAVSE